MIRKKAQIKIFLLLFCISVMPLSYCCAQDRSLQSEQLVELEKENPQLYHFEKRLMDIQQESQRIIREYQQAKIEKEEFEQQIVPLLKEELQIKNNPDYLIQQRLQSLIAMHSMMSDRKPQRMPRSMQR